MKLNTLRHGARWASIAVLAHGLTACGGSEDLPEEITKMRPVGVQNATVINLPGETGTAYVYVATPLGQTVTAESAAPEAIRAPIIGIPSVTIDPTPATTQNFAALALHKLKISFAIPSMELLKIAPGDFRRLRYGLTVKSGDQATTLINDIYVFPADSQEATTARDVPEVNIVTETAGRDTEVDIKAEVTKNNYDQTFKYGWFTSKGSIKNRQGRETKWKTPPEAGTYTLLFTAHGRKVRSFAITAKDITVP